MDSIRDHWLAECELLSPWRVSLEHTFREYNVGSGGFFPWPSRLALLPFITRKVSRYIYDRCVAGDCPQICFPSRNTSFSWIPLLRRGFLLPFVSSYRRPIGICPRCSVASKAPNRVLCEPHGPLSTSYYRPPLRGGLAQPYFLYSVTRLPLSLS